MLAAAAGHFHICLWISGRLLDSLLQALSPPFAFLAATVVPALFDDTFRYNINHRVTLCYTWSLEAWVCLRDPRCVRADCLVFVWERVYGFEPGQAMGPFIIFLRCRGSRQQAAGIASNRVLSRYEFMLLEQAMDPWYHRLRGVSALRAQPQQ